MTSLDARVFLALHDTLAHGPWFVLFVTLTVIGSGWGSFLIVPLFAAPRTRRFARSLALVLIATAVIVFALKKLVARARPCSSLEGVHALVFSAPSDFSFPSGHAAGSFAFAMFAAIVLVRTDAVGRVRLLRIAGAAALVLVAIGVALSRIALGVHFPGDVLAGALLGTSIAAVGARLHLSRSGTLREP